MRPWPLSAHRMILDSVSDSPAATGRRQPCTCPECGWCRQQRNPRSGAGRSRCEARPERDPGHARRLVGHSQDPFPFAAPEYRGAYRSPDCRLVPGRAEPAARGMGRVRHPARTRDRPVPVHRPRQWRRGARSVVSDRGAGRGPLFSRARLGPGAPGIRSQFLRSPCTHSTSEPPSSLARTRAITNSRSESRFR